ncbi:MAG: UDP-N-acetylmuramoyl-L-alanyl-D-glutamate--2,6-diaminopimelate ligase [Actinomycetota bacterium]
MADIKTLNDLVASLPSVEMRGAASVPILDVAYDSHQCRRGSLFFCVPGQVADGHDFAPSAYNAGAAALLVERFVDVEIPQVRVPSVRETMGPLSASFFGHPSGEMAVVGITGTNGKTTTTYLMESIFRAAGMPPGVIGTTGVRIDGEPFPAPHTTPEAPDLHRLLRRMADAGVLGVAMEVSSHGLDQDRVGGIRFRCAVFTNLSQDHLDYHDTMEEYFAAKSKLFTLTVSEFGVTNADSEYGRRLLDVDIPMVSYGVGDGADLRATSVSSTATGVSFEVDGVAVSSPLRGHYNVENGLAAFAAARSLGIEDGAIVDGIAALRGVPGRLEPVEQGQPFTVLVDYAHTPDSVENVLRAARPLTDGKVIVVLGCGGDRDRTKRPLMGRAATSLADLAIVTSDNPRSEDPAAIIAEIEPGAKDGGGRFEVEPDRRLAIRDAVRAAGPGDVVVIAGKGHETGQQFADRTIPFDDRIVAAEELLALRNGDG